MGQQLGELHNCQRDNRSPSAVSRLWKPDTSQRPALFQRRSWTRTQYSWANAPPHRTPTPPLAAACGPQRHSGCTGLNTSFSPGTSPSPVRPPPNINRASPCSTVLRGDGPQCCPQCGHPQTSSKQNGGSVFSWVVSPHGKGAQVLWLDTILGCRQ